MNKKVLFAIPFLGGGGAERVIVRILCLLDRARFSPILVLKEKTGAFVDDVPRDVAILDCRGYGFAGKFLWIPRFVRFLKSEDPDIVVSFLWYTNIVSLFARFVTRGRFRLILSERSTLEGSHDGFVPSLLRKVAVRLLYPAADRIVPNSEALGRQLIDRFGIAGEKVVPIPNPVAVEEIRRLRDEEDGPAAGGDGLPLVAGMGRFTREKGFDLLVRAMALVRPPSRLVLLGEGKEEGNLRELVRRLGLSGRVEFAGFRKNPYPLLGRAAVFVLPSRHEGFPNALLEAMALGLPCVATRCRTGPEEIVTDGEDGLLTPVEDPAALAEAVSRLLEDASLRERLGENARERVQGWNDRRIVGRFEDLIDETASMPQAARGRPSPRSGGTSASMPQAAREPGAEVSPSVCIVSPLYHPTLGGLGGQAKATAEHLRREGVRLFVISRRMSSVPRADFSPDVEVVRVPALLPGRHILEEVTLTNIAVSLSFSAGCIAALILRRKDYSVAHFQGASIPLFLSLPLLKLMRKKVVAMPASSQGTEAGSIRGRHGLLGRLLVREMRAVDAFVAISDKIHNGLLMEGIPSERIHRITNMVDVDLYRPPREGERESGKAAFGLGGKTVVTFCGRLAPIKGLEHLLPAWSEAVRTFPDARLLVLGEGPSRDSLERLASRLGIADTVRFEGRVDDVPARLRSSDVFVLSSLMEGLPNSLLEAMAAGLPAVATNVGGVGDIIEDGKNGLLAGPADPGGLAERIGMLLGDAGLRRRLGEAALRTVRERFSLDATVKRYIGLYRELERSRSGR